MWKPTKYLPLSMLLIPFLSLAGWVLWFEPQQLVVREIELELPHLAPAHDGLRIALLSDLHVGTPYRGLSNLNGVVGRVNQAKPDLILFLGDLVIQGIVGGAWVSPEACAVKLSGLRAPLGVYGVMGNHDWWLNAPRVATALEHGGMTLLENSSTRIAVKGSPLWLAGVSDFNEKQDDLDSALRGIPQEQPVILLSHSPDIFPEVPDRISLTVAGHTHGGQVNLPFLGRIWVPSKYKQRYASGHVIEQGRHLFVTVGIGSSILPIRFRVPPEIVILTIRPTLPESRHPRQPW